MTTNHTCDNIKINTKKGDKIVKGQAILVLLLLAAGSDMILWKVKNGIILAGLVIGSYYMLREQNYINCLLGALLPVLIFWPLFSIRAIGAGDIKLLSILGLFQGFAWLPTFLVKALLVGAILSMIQMICYRSLKSRFQYFFHYVTTLYMTRKPVRYYDASVDGRSMTIHFSAAILGAFLWEEILHL